MTTVRRSTPYHTGAAVDGKKLSRPVRKGLRTSVSISHVPWSRIFSPGLRTGESLQSAERGRNCQGKMVTTRTQSPLELTKRAVDAHAPLVAVRPWLSRGPACAGLRTLGATCFSRAPRPGGAPRGQGAAPTSSRRCWLSSSVSKRAFATSSGGWTSGDRGGLRGQCRLQGETRPQEFGGLNGPVRLPRQSACLESAVDGLARGARHTSCCTLAC